MNYLIYGLSFLLLINFCNNNNNRKTMNDNVLTETKSDMNSSGNSNEYESIEIKYWNGYNGKVHELKIEKGQLLVYCDISEVEIVIDEKEKKNLLIKLVKQFYIEKTDSIIIVKVKSEDALISNYSSIEVKIKDKGSLLVNQRTQIGSEEYEIEYNPEFMMLYELIQQLTSSCEKR